MATKYYILCNDGHKGPFDLAELLEAGIDHDTRIWPLGSKSALNAGEVPELAAALGTRAAAETDSDFEPIDELPTDEDTAEDDTPPTGNNTDLYARISSLEKECKSLRKKVKKIERDIKELNRQEQDATKPALPPPPPYPLSPYEPTAPDSENAGAAASRTTDNNKNFPSGLILLFVIILIVIISVLISVGKCSHEKSVDYSCSAAVEPTEQPYEDYEAAEVENTEYVY